MLAARLVLVLAKIRDRALGAERLQRLADVAPVQDEPVVRVQLDARIAGAASRNTLSVFTKPILASAA